MRTNHFTPTNFKIMLILGLYLFLGTVFATYADGVPYAIRKAIDEKFPGATINEIEQEMWKGQLVTEVELTSKDGVDYEVFISDSGKILNIEEEKKLPWGGGELFIGLAFFAGQDICHTRRLNFNCAAVPHSFWLSISRVHPN